MKEGWHAWVRILAPPLLSMWAPRTLPDTQEAWLFVPIQTLESLCPARGPQAGRMAPDRLRPGSGSRADRSAWESRLQLHTQHANFIHNDTKVDFSRNVLCQRGES